MITPHVRIRSQGEGAILAFVTIAGDKETRVRWLAQNWRCDTHGPSPWPNCPHKLAVVNSDAYTYEGTLT